MVGDRALRFLLHPIAPTGPFLVVQATGHLLPDVCSVQQRRTSGLPVLDRVVTYGVTPPTSGARLLGKRSVSTLMAHSHALELPLVRTYTLARCVEVDDILRNRAVCDLIFPIVTPLKYAKWYEFLSEAGVLEQV
jgi:hypothetical protein